MHKSALACGIGLSSVFCLIACQKEGLTVSNDGGGAGGSLAQGGVGDAATSMGGGVAGAGGHFGAGGSAMGGLPATGGLLSTTGGVRATGGMLASGGGLGTGGRAATGGAVGVGGTLAKGGAGGATGRGGAGGVIVSGGATAVGGIVASGGAVGAGGATGTGGAGALCGGIAGLSCPPNRYCDFPGGTCGNADMTGTCAVIGAGLCSDIYAPVCGCNGKTYPNDCVRQQDAVSKASDGTCPTSTSACPATIAQIKTWPCTAGLTCEYGTDPRPACRESATCTNGSWVVTTPAPCAVLPVVTCPATREAAAGQACTASGAYCTYGDLSCQCTNCTTGPVDSCAGDPTWHCAAPNADATCPAGIPLLGSACTTANQTCSYSCGAGGARLCKGGAWYSASGGPCPVSNRRAKKDIVYLRQADRLRLADELARFKLATYEYRDPALAGKRHLGFIIEDVPGSPAVDRDGNMVDLYGYASMLVAAVQAQGEEIAKLKTELARMKRHSRSK
jgi:hypothetical protein